MPGEAQATEDEGDSERTETLVPVRRAERTFGRYELAYEIASGGMATIYLARAKGPGGFDRPVAIKRIHPHLAKQKDFVEMFLDEVSLAARINHPNVCSVYDFGEVDGTYFMAMEYLLGQPLTGLLRALSTRRDVLGSLRWQVLAARIVADACEGLHAAHELKDSEGRPLGVVHRDVSPHNIFATYDGAVKVVDFGVAWARGRVHETRTGTVKGKFAYMAPEQVRGAALDRRVDVWALGVCLWELLTATRLFGPKKNEAELVYAVAHDPLRLPSQIVPVPDALERIVMRALERDVEQRYPSARAMARDLNAFVLASGVLAGMPELEELIRELFGKERTKTIDIVTTLLSTDDLEVATYTGPRAGAATREHTETFAPAPRAGEKNALRTVVFIGAALLAVVALIAGSGIALYVMNEPEPRPLISVEETRAIPPPPPARVPEPIAMPAVPAPEPAPVEPAPEPPARETGGVGTLNVAARGGWAEILLDGRPVGTTPRRLSVSAGRHVVELRSRGRPSVRRVVTVRRGRTSAVVIPLD